MMLKNSTTASNATPAAAATLGQSTFSPVAGHGPAVDEHRYGGEAIGQ